MLKFGDCSNLLKNLPNHSVDALVTDPPAGISFMGKDWDHHKGGRKEWCAWMESVMRECFRAMKPGAHGLVWALPRTSHWTATALEDAGFQIRDVVTHLFGSGFPKSHNISKAIDKAAGANRKVIGHQNYSAPDIRRNSYDQPHVGERERLGVPITAAATDAVKQWEGFGTALKPASEHWILVQKPISEKTIVANVLKWGVGGLNIDGCRIGVSESPNGRFPANLVLSHSDHCTDTQCDLTCPVKMLDEQSGILKQGVAGKKSRPFGNGEIYGTCAEFKPNGTNTYACDKPSGASRFFYCAKASKSDKNAGLDDKIKKAVGNRPNSADMTGKFPDHDQRERVGNFHPTVKSTKLMSYLIKLITPPNGVVLDPFMGSGSTGVAAKALGFIGIEREKEYFEIAEKRIGASV